MVDALLKADNDHRQKESARKARYRRRQSDDIMVYPVPLHDDEVVTMIDLEWITEQESKDRKKVGEAVAASIKTLRDHRPK